MTKQLFVTIYSKKRQSGEQSGSAETLKERKERETETETERVFTLSALFLFFLLVEVTGVEPVSKHDVQKLSTCLFQN
jgi:hypothetical protein